MEGNAVEEARMRESSAGVVAAPADIKFGLAAPSLTGKCQTYVAPEDLVVAVANLHKPPIAGHAASVETISRTTSVYAGFRIAMVDDIGERRSHPRASFHGALAIVVSRVPAFVS